MPDPRRLPTLLTIVLALGATGSRLGAAEHASPDERIIATHRGGTVTATQYASWLRYRGSRAEELPRSQEIENMVFVTVLAREARDAAMAEEGPARAELALLVDRRLAAALRRHRSESIVVTEQEIEEALAGSPGAFQKPPRVRLRTLFKRLPPNADVSARQALRRELEALRTRVGEGTAFAELARTDSDSQARFRDGLIGNVGPGELPAEIERIAFSLEPGEVSDIVEVADGYSLFYCEERLPPVVRSPAEVHGLVAESLHRFETKQDWKRYRQALLDRAAPRFDVGPNEDSEIVARYDGGTISRTDLSAWRRILAVPSPNDPSEEVTQSTAEQLLETRLAAAEARRLGLDRDPTLTERLEWEEAVYLATRRLAALVAGEVTRPSEAEIRSYFEAHRDRFVRRQHFDLSVILRTATEEDLPRVYAETLALRDRIEHGEVDFATAARAHSEHPSSANGGRLGWVARFRMAALGRNVFNTILEMQPGETSRLVQQDRALWIVRLHGVEPERPLTWEEAREAVEAALGNEITQRVKDAIESRLRSGLEIELLP